MSLRYFLDGYNVLHQMPQLLRGKLEEQRERLIRFLESQQLQGSLKNSLTVVFDGQPGHYGAKNTTCIKVIFSCGESADTKIRNIVTEAKAKKNIVVVTDDRDIQYAVRAQGAKVMKVKEFLQPAVKKRTQRGSKQPKGTSSQGKYIPKVDEAEINSEFSKLWLNKRRDEKR